MASQQVRQMITTIERECEYAAPLTGHRGIRQKVLQAMAEVPREEFVPPSQRPYAYADRALPIGDGQTISQPFIVALMTDLLDPTTEDVMLEVGTGAGYQTAILSRLIKKVYTIEVVPPLAEAAEERLRRLGYTNIEARSGDGYEGWPQKAPFDGIIVTAAAHHVPPPLVEQLKSGAVLVLPVGEPGRTQILTTVSKDGHGLTRRRNVLDVAFVPLTGGHGEPTR